MMTGIPAGIHGSAAAQAITLRASFTQSAQATSWALGNVLYPTGATAGYLGVVCEGGPGVTWAATLGGISMTELAAARIGASSVASLFYILAATIPAGGTNRAIVVTATNAVSGYARFWSATGVTQAAPLATIGESTAANFTVTRTGVLINSLLFAICALNTTTSMTDATLTSAAGTWDNQFKNSVAVGGHWGVFGDRVAAAAGSFDAIATNVGGVSTSRRLSTAIVEIR